MSTSPSRRHILKIAAAAPILSLQAQAALAQSAPGRVIRLVVPAPPGSSPDAFARLLAEKVTKSLGQPVIVDNKPGAAGIIGAEAVARSPADGLTLLYAHSGVMAMNPHIYPRLPYDALKDFVGVSHAVTVPCALCAALDAPFNTLSELVSKAKAQPGAINYGSYGTGTLSHVVVEAICSLAGIKMTHIPYKSMPLPDLISNTIQLAVEPVNTALPLLQTAKIKAIAVTSAERLSVLPNVATISETYPGFTGDTWQAVYAPRGVPAATVEKLGEAFSAAMNAPDVKKIAVDQGLIPVASGPAQLESFTAAEFKKWGKIVRDNGIRVE